MFINFINLILFCRPNYSIMTHKYNARSNSSHKHKSIVNVDALAKLEHNIISNINNLGGEIINMKDTSNESLLEENEKLRQKCRNFEGRVVIRAEWKTEYCYRWNIWTMPLMINWKKQSSKYWQMLMLIWKQVTLRLAIDFVG